MPAAAYAELHVHTNFSFLDGASSPADLVERAVALGMSSLGVTDHGGLYGVVRFASAASEAGIHPVVGIEVELADPAVPDLGGLVVPGRRPRGRARAAPGSGRPPPRDGLPFRPLPDRALLPGHRDAVKEDHRGVGRQQRGPHLVLLARDESGYRSLCRLVSRANLAGSKGAPQVTQALLGEHADGIVALSGCREGEVARRLRAGDRAGARATAERYATIYGQADGVARAGFFLEMTHHLLPDDDWLVDEIARLAGETGLPVVVTNDVHYARPEDRELHDVLTAIRHGRSLGTLADLRTPSGEHYLKSAAELGALPPADEATAGPAVARAWAEGIANAGELAASCSLDLGFERYRFPGFPVPAGETPFSYLVELCQAGVRRRYHPVSPPVVRQLAHELDVIERTGLAEFFLICWDLMRFAKEHRIPAQGRGSAADSIVAYALGITRVDPIRHNLLFERFINEGRTTYPDVDIDFSSERREEVIQYVYERYGAEHTGMVCNLVTYRARSAVREVGCALGFPRPLVDRVAKALETYDSVMVRRDLETDGGFAEFFRHPDADPGNVPNAAAARTRGLVDGMGQLNHERGGRLEAGEAARLTGTLPGTGSRPSIRGGGPGADRGGPGDSPASVAWLARERIGHSFGPGAGPPRQPAVPGLVDGRPIDPESGVVAPPTRSVDRLGRPRHWDTPAPRVEVAPLTRPGGAGRDVRQPRSSVARIEPDPVPRARGGSVAGLPPWERWLELCARIDGFPRHLSIHSGGMLVTAAPLVDIAPLERATMPDRVVVQFDKRDVETLKLIKLDLLGLGMLAAIDETVQLVEHDCATCLDLDRIPEEIPEVFAMLQAADTVGVFQVESRAQMQTLPKSRPDCLDDLVVEVAIIRPGPIQGNAVHPYLRRKQGLEPVTYLHSSLEPILRDSLGVILYQEQVMRIAIDVAGYTPAESDGFRRAMGTWRSTAEMEKLHARFVDGCVARQGMPRDDAEELYRQVAGFASFGFAKSHAAAFARTAYESAFLKLFYPAQFLVGLINAQPMGFYPVEVLVNDAKRHGVSVLPVDVNASFHRTTTEWAGQPGWVVAGAAGDDGSRDLDLGHPLPPGAGIAARPRPIRSPACVVPQAATRARWAAGSATGWGVRLGLHLVKGIGAEHAGRLDAELGRGPYASLVDVVERTGLPEEVLERLIRVGALDSLGRPRRELLWQLREVARPARGAPRGGGRVAGRPLDLRIPATPAPDLPPVTEIERLGDSYAVLSLDARRQVMELFRPTLDRMGAVTNAGLASREPGQVRIGGLVVTRQHPMTARGTVFLALEDESGMANVTLWPDVWARLRGVVRRNALLVVDGILQREAGVVNVVATDVRPLVEEARHHGGPQRPDGIRQLGWAGMRRLG
jgi:error-prone DNA polymerase